MKIRKAAIIAASMLMMIVFVRMNEDVSSYLAAVKSGGASLAISKIEHSDEEKRQLYDTIVAEAANKREAPVNAVIDRVWRAIPGYNGIEVDVDRTYEAALRLPASNAIPYIFKEIEPTIKLEDLGAHPVYRGNPNKKMIAFMINVAWGNEFIEPMLKTLEQERVKATFFLDGSWLNKNAEMARKIQAAGHEMSNHAYSHPNMSELSRGAAYTQIAKTEELLKSTLGVNNRWFAPPSGDFNQMTVQVAREQGLQTVLWTIDTVDWRKPSAESIVHKINAKLEPGALILMHPTASSRDALAGMIASAKAKGYALGTVSETLSSDRIASSVVEGADLF
ncbi:polysaccharide deacetylase family protein [Paenibacillus harenae]|uniref:Sporulation protein (Polysaccharide deacetylase family) n=1 Tax=Paenibacillus harenae TaxID=306543 RepID=A0ABT9U1J8_PAEHA|nr:polysaccharide deacetylase family protein [Paenibacillus harenae]MDQ0113127.1 putative sporulation protein (polysaccharide deacetylase family) [Paenibacillus harenae]